MYRNSIAIEAYSTYCICDISFSIICVFVHEETHDSSRFYDEKGENTLAHVYLRNQLDISRM